MTPDQPRETGKPSPSIKSPSLRLNYIFNFIGSAWTAALGILFVPIYLRYLGIEAYGIIGLFTSLQAIFFLLDLGLSPAFNREIARCSISQDRASAERLRSLTRTLSRVNLGLSVLIGTVACLMAPLLAAYWVNASALSVADVTESFIIMGIASAVQFPMTFYMSGLAGLQRQVTGNLITIFFGTIRSVGAIVVLIAIDATLQAFLLWQLVVSVLQLGVTSVAFYRALPPSPGRCRFDLTILRELWRFAAGNMGIGISALILSQTDKLVLSRMLPLEEFGYYSLATMISTTALVMMTSSVSRVAFPEFSALVANGDEDNLARAYHKNAQLVTVTVGPAAAVLALFSGEILFLWTGDATIADRGQLLLTLTAIAVGLNCLAWIPYFMQLAHGHTRLTFFLNLFAIGGLVLLLLIFVPEFGALGGALAVTVVQVCNLIVYIALMHRKILPNDRRSWVIWDNAVPLAAICGTALLGSTLVPENPTRLGIFVTILLVTAASYLCGVVTASVIRSTVGAILKNRFSLVRALFL